MDHALRWRLDLIIGLLTFVSISMATVLVMLGGLWGLGFVLLFGLLVAFFLQGLGYFPFQVGIDGRRGGS